MVGAMVIALVAAVVMLVAGVAALAGRLLTMSRGLRAELEGTRARVQPMVTELGENVDIARIESQAVQASMAALRDGVRQVRG